MDSLLKGDVEIRTAWRQCFLQNQIYHPPCIENHRKHFNCLNRGYSLNYFILLACFILMQNQKPKFLRLSKVFTYALTGGVTSEPIVFCYCETIKQRALLILRTRKWVVFASNMSDPSDYGFFNYHCFQNQYARPKKVVARTEHGEGTSAQPDRAPPTSAQVQYPSRAILTGKSCHGILKYTLLNTFCIH